MKPPCPFFPKIIFSSVRLNVTSFCPLYCSFCTTSNKGKREYQTAEQTLLSLEDVEATLGKVDRVTISGGEPLIDIEELSRTVRKLYTKVDDIRLETAGVNWEVFSKSDIPARINTLYLNRPHYQDDRTNDILGTLPGNSKEKNPTFFQIMEFIQRWITPVIAVCPLVYGGIDSGIEIVNYLDAMALAGVSEVEFRVIEGKDGYPKGPSIMMEIRDLENLSLGKGQFKSKCSCDYHLYHASNGKFLPYRVVTSGGANKGCTNNVTSPGSPFISRKL